LAIAEPATLVTDWALGVLCVVLAARLLRLRRDGPVRLMASAFVCLAAAAFCGGTVHGFAQALAMNERGVLWAVVYAGIGLANVTLVAGVLWAVVPWAGPFVLAVQAARAVYLLLRLARGVAAVDVYDLAATLVVGLGGGLAFTWLRPRPFGPWLLAGILVSVAGGAIQMLRLAPHPQFNHNDVFHVVQMAAQVCFYKAALAFPAGPADAQRRATIRAPQGQ
jgi:hypothetical protein